VPNRRNVVKMLAGATVGTLVGNRTLAEIAFAAAQGAPGARRRVTIDGRRITVVDVHAHTFVPEVLELVKNTPLAGTSKNNLTGSIALGPGNAARLQYMDKEGIGYQALNVNAWGYSAERALARDLISLGGQTWV
jgi:hypothetical protein